MEQIPNNELAERVRIVAMLAEKGFEDSETKAELIRWHETKKAQRGEGYEETIRVTIELALVFKDASLPDIANDLLEEAYQDAFQMKDVALCAEIDGIIDSL